MANIRISTNPTGRSPENKFFFGEKTRCLDMSRPKYNKIGKQEDFDEFCQKYSAVDREMKPTEKTKSMWYPKLEITKNSLLRWIEE